MIANIASALASHNIQAMTDYDTSPYPVPVEDIVLIDDIDPRFSSDDEQDTDREDLIYESQGGAVYRQDDIDRQREGRELRGELADTKGPYRRVATRDNTAGISPQMYDAYYGPEDTIEQDVGWTARLRRWWEQRKNKKGSVIGGVTLLTNGIVSAGILALAEPFKFNGYIGGLILTIVVMLLTRYSFTLLYSQGSFGRGRYGYTAVSIDALGERGGFWFDIFAIINGFGTDIAYFILIANFSLTINNYISADSGVLNKGWFWLIIFALIVTFLATRTNNIAFFELTTYYSSFHFIFFSVIVYAIFIAERRDDLPPINTVWFRIDSNIFKSIVRLGYAFMAHTMLLPLYRNLSNKRQGTIGAISWASMYFAAWMYLMVAGFGYATFGDSVGGNLLDSYRLDNDLVNVIRFMYIGEITLSLPIHINPQVEHWQSALSYASKRWPHIIPYRIPRRGGNLWKPLSIVLIAVTATIAGLIYENTNSFGRIVTFTGATASSAIAYIFPSLTYLINSYMLPHSFRKLNAVLLLIFGVFVGATTNIVEIVDIAVNGW